MRLTVLICTHNRSALLQRTLASLNMARRPDDCQVEILVVVNACTDASAEVLRRQERESGVDGRLPLRWTEEPKPGKSNALNRAIPMIADGIVAFVDDDHRVDERYLVAVAQAARRYPDISMFCGRILPDWDGKEPNWVHDTGPYRIYPLPIPRYDDGALAREIGAEGPLPGGGNLSIRRAIFDRVGPFSSDLGPHGHDLGGGEDSDFVQRCIEAGERIQYVPDMVQYHYVDQERLRFSYLLRKSFQRSRSGVRTRPPPSTSVPLYMWRKIATYLILGVLSLSWARTRFYLVRLAAGLGEVQGFLDVAGEVAAASNAPSRPRAWMRRHIAFFATLAALSGIALIASKPGSGAKFAAALLAAAVFSAVLLLKSFYDFSQTGPPLKHEILRHYRAYSLLALLRLGFWAFVICTLMAASGVLIYVATAQLAGKPWGFFPAVVTGLTAILTITALQFCKHLLFLPASIAASYHYRLSRLYLLWRRLTPRRLLIAQCGIVATGAAIIAASVVQSLMRGDAAMAIGLLLLMGAAALGAAALSAERAVPVRSARSSGRPNIIMIGSDTLRADRADSRSYKRSVAPFIDSLARRGTQFTSCYVPCARTAPSLISLFTGSWPHRHGIRDNFIGDAQARLDVPAIATILASEGYTTASVSDWCGGDLGKFPLGFQIRDLPRDQWNIKYLIRQGPKDLRLFLSLFTHNRLGKRLIPELYYLAGVPMTSLVGRDARALISEFAEQSSPFLLNVFLSTTHPPFGSEYPYYTLWADKTYSGESKFVMARLTDPWEIIRRQGDTRKDFDLEQIIDLYDGSVRNFDDEVKRIVTHLKHCGLEQDTIIVIYSDHGMEFFEHDTWGQGNSVRGDFSARVPLLIVDPRVAGPRRCSAIVRSIDVAPTLLELAGSATPDMDGISLVPYLKGETYDMGLAAFNETGTWLTDVPGLPDGHLRYPSLLDLLEVPDKRTGTLAIKPEYQQAIITAKDRMVCVGSWKLTYQPTKNGPLYALFNLSADPECRHDVASAHPDVVRRLKQQLADWMMNDPRPSDAYAAESAPSPAAPKAIAA